MKLYDIKSVDIAEEGCKLTCRYDNLILQETINVDSLF